jgi:hypothetical protein
VAPQGLNPGDRVVELASLAISAAVATGAVASAWILWLIKKSWVISAGALIAGGVIGFLVGQLVGRVFYRTGGNTTVVKVGSAALPSTIPAGLAGGAVKRRPCLGLRSVAALSSASCLPAWGRYYEA